MIVGFILCFFCSLVSWERRFENRRELIEYKKRMCRYECAAMRYKKRTRNNEKEKEKK